MDELKRRWEALWGRLKKTYGVRRPLSVFLINYCEMERFYHNLDHIAHCLREFDEVGHLCQNSDELEMAIWFHDIIYDTHSKCNEENSALYIDSLLKEHGLPVTFRQNVISLIIATKHYEIPKEIDEQIIVDIDLSILGQSEQAFLEYEKQIRLEYHWVSDREFADKRAEKLQSFLDRKYIYFTEFFRQKYEKQARKNLEESLHRLKNA